MPGALDFFPSGWCPGESHTLQRMSVASWQRANKTWPSFQKSFICHKAGGVCVPAAQALAWFLPLYLPKKSAALFKCNCILYHVLFIITTVPEGTHLSMEPQDIISRQVGIKLLLHALIRYSFGYPEHRGQMFRNKLYFSTWKTTHSLLFSFFDRSYVECKKYQVSNCVLTK